MDGKTALDVVFDHLAAGDVPAALDRLSPDAQVWHCFDRIAHGRDGAAREWTAFVENFPERTFTDVRSQATANGFLRQHVMTVRTAAGQRLSWEVCIVVVTDGDYIQRLDEYLDRAGNFSPTAEDCQ
jgi:ketosteroid isomerase-like protein